MSKSQNKNILLILTGSIACYKACTVMSRLKQQGHNIKVVMSPSSLEFVGAATIEGLTGEAPITDMYAQGNVMDHIHLVRWADLILVAPATANYINKISHGLGDDLLSTLFLAHDFTKPFLIAPAMNTKMYLHPVTQESIQKLRNMGIEILETASGVLACGEIGSGRLLEPDLIIQEVEKNLQTTASAGSAEKPQKRTGKVLITAGGTSEPIDDVRVITNRSSGRTAATLADFLIQSGLQVTFLHSQNSVLPKSDCEKIAFESFGDLQAELTAALKKNTYTAVIHAAAVSDYSITPQNGKINSDQNEIQLTLKRNPKLISEIKKIQPQAVLFAFKLTSGLESAAVLKKVTGLFESSRCNFVVQNEWADIRDKNYRYSIYGSELQAEAANSLPELAQNLFQKIIKSEVTL